MAAFALTDVDAFVDGLDASCFANMVSVNVEVAELDKTTFCSGGWREVIGGIKSVAFELEGPQDLATAAASATSGPDQELGLLVGNAYTAAFVPAGSSSGAVAYFTSARLMSYSPWGDAVGDLATWKTSWMGTERMVRGVCAHAATLTATGQSAAHQIGAVSASQRMYAAFVVQTAGGTTPSITVKLQSDDNAGFTSATDRITFTAATAKGGQFSSVAGAVTDDYWRLQWTITGTTPSFQFRGFIGLSTN